MRRLLIAMFFCVLGSLCYAQGNPTALEFSRLEIKAKADLADVTFTYHFTVKNTNANIGMQIFAHREDIKNKEQWDQISPVGPDGSPLILSLYKGLDATGTFKAPLPKGEYGAVRLLMFRSLDGKSMSFNHTVYDSLRDKVHGGISLKVKVETNDSRVNSPILTYSKNTDLRENADGTFRLTIPVVVKIPKGFTAQDNGLWVMAKSPGGFAQEWANLASVQPSGDPHDDYGVIPMNLQIKDFKPGLWNLQFGLFPQGFAKTLFWTFPGLDVEIGGDAWVIKTSPDRIPPRVRVRSGHFETVDHKPHDFYADNPAGRKAVTFVRGGNYGNAITWVLKPELDRPGFFVLLKSMGCHFMRFNFNPDRYMDEISYQHAVDQVVQNMWAGGLYPVICPQDLPQGQTLEERVEKGEKVARTMAVRYKNKSVWLEVCNEPHEFASWAAWKPVATRYVKAIRAIDADALVIVPFENFSKDGRQAAKDPITDTEVDLYDGHAYVEPADVVSLFGPAIKAGLPVLIGEYGGGDKYLGQIDAALQKLPGLIAAGPWAFTIAGQDSLPLVEDGATAELRMTAAGKTIQEDYAAWDAGKSIVRTAH